MPLPPPDPIPTPPGPSQPADNRPPLVRKLLDAAAALLDEFGFPYTSFTVQVKTSNEEQFFVPAHPGEYVNPPPRKPS